MRINFQNYSDGDRIPKLHRSLKFWGYGKANFTPRSYWSMESSERSILPLPIRMPKALPYGQTHTGTGKVPIYKCTASYVDKPLTHLRWNVNFLRPHGKRTRWRGWNVHFGSHSNKFAQKSPNVVNIMTATTSRTTTRAICRYLLC